MSALFDQTQTTAKPNSQTLETPTDDDPYSALVGEGKKFKDNQALARGKLEGDKHIKNLESELAGLREELDKRISLEKFLDRLEPRTEPTQNEPTKAAAQGQTITQEDIASTVKQILSTEKEVSTRQSNVNLVQAELEKAWGRDYRSKLEEAASEIDGGKELLSALAETNPKAVLKLLGVNQPAKQQVNTDALSPPRSTSTFSNAPVQRENYAYFEKMRREDPKRYWSPATQMRLHKVVEEMGDSFNK